METLALIPARSGSKGIPHKNIRPFRGKPLLAHSIEQALLSSRIHRVIVSTDSAEYAAIAREFGAEAPFLRPANASDDLSTDLQVFQHALAWLQEHQAYRPDILVHLRPTFPTRRVEDVDKAIDLLQKEPICDSVRSVVPSPATPFKMWFPTDDGFIRPVVTDPSIPEACSQPRQLLRTAYQQNACVDVVWTRVVLELNSMTGARVRPMPMIDDSDIDELWEFERAESLHGARSGEPRVFVVDIDGVLADLTPENDYAKATPLQENIEAVNALHDRGHRIILFTARGSATGIDWRATTAAQMKTWGVKHDDLQFGKPAGDYYIDDRMISINELRKLARD